MRTIAEFIEETGVSMTATPVPANPHMDSMPEDSSHFHITLEKSDGRPMVTYFSVGPGIVDTWIMQHGKPKWCYGHFTREHFKANPRTIAAADYRELCREDYRPDLSAVLTCLADDSASAENAPTFEDWASDFGYDSDSRKALRIFEICCEQSRALRALLGPVDYNALIWETERE